ncbi:transcriptional regulator with XRE-family HTH domain [Streptomyces sp. B3I7]|uniref:helix-turn-helix transcriptional regulator n=1 Tax=Streptomyces sp. B3I7 TaxID=3042269 RepID=UPI00277DA386|nr:helix-turn-helix transcriptional regulator [Streptomyces sp. B3I7]MDQ0810213.1 transcriptional regulator with XRE-family HTH domain [Streptomyces sp. B3I7]
MGEGDEHEGELGPEEIMGLAGLLRAWRAAAGFKLGRGKPLTQAEVAHATGMSEKWYRQLERGAVPRISPEFVEKLADVLALTPDEKQALSYYTPGAPLITRAPVSDETPPRHTLQFLLDLQLPHPAYLCDATWNLIAYNRTMADWFPWVTEPGANLMRWALLRPGAREQTADWEEHARIYLAMIRMELTRRLGNRDLTALLREAYEDPVCRRLWDESPRVVAHRDNHRFRLRLPHFDRQEIEVVTHVWFPASYPDLRFVVLTWLGSQTDAPPLLDAAPPPARSGAGDAQTADGGVALPALSAAAGPECRLTFYPGAGTVRWTDGPEEGGDCSSVLSVQAVLDRLVPDPIDRTAAFEYEQLLRATLPGDQDAALAGLDAQISDLSARLALAQELRLRLEAPSGS